MILQRFLIGILILAFANGSFSADKSGSKNRRITKSESKPVTVDLPWTTDDVPPSLSQFDNNARNGDEVDRVLNVLEIGYGAQHSGKTDLAVKAYDYALDQIDSIDAKSKTSQRARSLFAGEEEKVFKGEPYERSMAFFYRGVLAAQAKEYELARACFRSASFYDSNSAQQYEGDYVIHYWMEAKMDQLLGETDRAVEVFQWAAESAEIANLQPASIPSTDPSANVILIVEAGSCPVKVGLGQYKSVLSFDPPLQAPPEGGIALKQGTVELIRLSQPTEDILSQARSRGKRMADRINNSKAAFKSFSDAIGTGAIIGGGVLASQSNNRDSGMAGGILLLSGLIMKGVSQATNPTADLRSWSSLPTQIYLVPAILESNIDLELWGFDAAGNPIGSKTIAVTPGIAQNPNFLLVRLN